MENNVSEIIVSYIDNVNNNSDHRYKSWEHCFYFFKDLRNGSADESLIDAAALHLFTYLASWGMYRGSSFLLQKDYKVHIPIIKIILNKKYDKLLAIKPENYDSETINLLFILIQEIKDNYQKIELIDKKKKVNATDTLITKILLGTLGCIPAFDTYFNKEFRKEFGYTNKLNQKSFLALLHLSGELKLELLKAKDLISKKYSKEYPLFKLLDMYFWKKAEINYKQVKKSYNFNIEDIRKVEFYSGGYFGGHKNIEVGLLDSSKIPSIKGNSLGFPFLKPETWELVKIKLFYEIKVQNWTEDYVDLNVLDGNQWELNITLMSNKKIKIYGSNAYPSNFKKLKEMFENIDNIF